MDFMYNDDNIIDPNKIDATMELLSQIRAQEERLGVKLIDSIGTQMHIDNNVSKEEIRNAFIEFNNYPCEYRDCSHINTEGCEIALALLNNEILETRYNNYCGFINEIKKGE